MAEGSGTTTEKGMIEAFNEIGVGGGLPVVGAVADMKVFDTPRNAGRPLWSGAATAAS
jgi:hypothetical protein